MADEIAFNYLTSKTLYSIRFQLAGNVFLTSGASDEVWGAGGNDADAYDVTMTETTIGSSRHYAGDFDTSGNIAEGVYRVTVYDRAGGSPADTDIAIGQKTMHWDGTAEKDHTTMTDLLGNIVVAETGVLNVYRDTLVEIEETEV